MSDIISDATSAPLRKASRWLRWPLGAYALVWITLEGSLTGLAILTALCLLWCMLAGLVWLTERGVSRRNLLPLSAGLGAALGIAVVPLALVLMTVKTGLHNHGPEFSPAEISVVVQNWPVWLGACVLVTVGLALVDVGNRPN